MHSQLPAQSEKPPLIHLTNVNHTYKSTNQDNSTLKNINLLIQQGERCALLGKSGSGKSTLLNILGLLDQPSSGTYLLNGIDCSRTSTSQLAAMRSHEIGFIFQNFNLLPRMTAIENIALPLLYRGVQKSIAKERAHEMIKSVGIADRANSRPAELSGGQRQRVAIARALIGTPSLILADEPTGSLDTSSAAEIMDLLLELNDTHSTSLIVVTHDQAVASRFQRQLKIELGELRETPHT